MKVLVKPRWAPVAHWTTADAPLDGAVFDPPVTGTVYGVILNVRSQVEALGEALSAPPYGKPPVAPVLYIKPPNTYAGDGAVLAVPAGTEALEVNATLAVVIGETACRVADSHALDHVLGYAVAIDACIPHANLHRPAIRQRCRDGFLPIGPWVTARDEVADPDALTVTVAVNGQEKIRWSTAELVRPVARLIADISDFMTLFEGDVLLVGLPPNGPQARVGDRVEAQIAGVGKLTCTLAEDAA